MDHRSPLPALIFLALACLAAAVLWPPRSCEQPAAIAEARPSGICKFAAKHS